MEPFKINGVFLLFTFVIILVINLSGADFSNRCNQPVKSGWCWWRLRRYYFNARSGRCEIFLYRGCGGNDNNFVVLEECKKACFIEEPPEVLEGPFKAVVSLNVGTGTSGVSGVLELDQKDKNEAVYITGIISGLTPGGAHGFHVHQSGDVRGDSPCRSTGGHFNPHGKTHGAPNDDERHIGDLGNIVADDQGNAVISIVDHEISLTGSFSIVGRAIVVHAKADDLGKGGDEGSLRTGNAGGRIACGIIGTIFQA